MTRSSNKSPDRRTQEIALACHVHSEWSYDGKWSLPALAREFRRRGYRAIMMTEHDRGFTEARWKDYQAACGAASSPEMLLVPGIEYSDPDNIVHILVWGPVPFLGEALPTGELLDKVNAAGGIAVFAHPSRKEACNRFDPAWAAHLLGIELWNRKTDGWAPSRSASGILSGRGLSQFAGLDFHDRRQFFPLSMRLALAGAVNEQPLLAALRAHRMTPYIFGRPFASALQPIGIMAFSVAEGIRRPLARGARKLARSLHWFPPRLKKQAA